MYGLAWKGLQSTLNIPFYLVWLRKEFYLTQFHTPLNLTSISTRTTTLLQPQNLHVLPLLSKLTTASSPSLKRPQPTQLNIFPYPKKAHSQSRPGPRWDLSKTALLQFKNHVEHTHTEMGGNYARWWFISAPQNISAQSISASLMVTPAWTNLPWPTNFTIQPKSWMDCLSTSLTITTKPQPHYSFPLTPTITVATKGS